MRVVIEKVENGYLIYQQSDEGCDDTKMYVANKLSSYSYSTDSVGAILSSIFEPVKEVSE